MKKKNNRDNKVDFSKIAKNIRKLSIKDFVHTYSLPYAHYTINDRALISEDGLKPVNRRLLYSMFLNGNYNGKMTKAGTVAARCMGDFHPHGNSSIEDALARMGQTFNIRVPLIDVQGSVGKFTKDKASAARYWECSLSKEGYELVKDIKNKAVPMTRNFADTTDEPIQLPISFPIGIINGTQGIAVGFASDIPCHNPKEVMEALILRLENKIKTTKELLEIMKGPDYPTGGKLLGIDEVEKYFETGKGTFIIRGKYNIEDLPRGKKFIDFYELPYQVSAEDIIKSIQDNQSNKRFQEISEVKDLSDRYRGASLGITLKVGSNVEKVISELWAFTPLENKYSPNLTVLDKGKPKLLSMLELIDQFLNFKRENFLSKTKKEIEKIESKIFELDGLLKVLLDLDKTIKIIRNSKTTKEAKEGLIKNFKIEEEQSDYILALPLRTLTKADIIEIEKNKKEKDKEKERLDKILKDEKVLKKEIKKELEATLKIIEDDRKVEITEVTTTELKVKKKAKEELLEIKLKEFKVSFNPISMTLEKDDEGKSLITEDFGIISFEGLNKIIPHSKIKERITLEDLSNIDAVGFSSLNHPLLVVSNKGNVNIINKGLNKDNTLVSKLEEDEKLIFATPVYNEEGSLIMVNEESMIINIPLNKIRNSNIGAGLVAGMKTKTNIVSAFISYDKNDIIISYSSNKEIKKTYLKEIKETGRGGKGILLQKLSKNTFLEKAFLDNQEFNDIEVSERTKKGKIRRNKLF